MDRAHPRRPHPQTAKQLGRRAPLRPNWDRDRVLYMRAILHAKFTSDPDLTQLLLDTGDALLIEGNTWGDDYWGRVLRPGLATAVGHNWLGRSLMRLRSELAGHDAQRWVRVAATGHREHLIDADLHPWVRDELARLAIKLRDEHGTQLGLSDSRPEPTCGGPTPPPPPDWTCGAISPSPNRPPPQTGTPPAAPTTARSANS